MWFSNEKRPQVRRRLSEGSDAWLVALICCKAVKHGHATGLAEVLLAAPATWGAWAGFCGGRVSAHGCTAVFKVGLTTWFATVQVKEQFPDIAFGEVGKKLGGCCSAPHIKLVWKGELP